MSRPSAPWPPMQPYENSEPRDASVTSSHSGSSPSEFSTQFRRAHSKTRNGCVVCKIRRIKCDETKPHCKKCTSTGRKCEGYEAAKPRRESPKIDQGSLVDHFPRSIKACTLSSNTSGLSMGIGLPLDSLHSRKLAHIPGHFEPHFWNQIVLRFGHSYPAVQHALVALDAIYDGNDRDLRSPVKNATISMRNSYVLHQYDIALRHLIEYLSSTQQDARATLLSCLVFVWVEILQNNLESAFKHLESGLKILRQIKEATPVPFSEGMITTHGEEDVCEVLSRSFIRLSSQAATHGTYNEVPEIATISATTLDGLPPIPYSFSSIFESRSFLDNELNFVFSYIRTLRDKDHYASIEMLAIDRFRKTHLERVRQWHLATMSMARTVSAERDPFQTWAISYLELYHILLRIMLKTLFGGEMAFDKYNYDFERMIAYAEAAINKPAAESPPVLSFDINIIPPLFFLALKCRVLRLRRQAVALLRLAPEREGMWRRDSVIKVCEWKIMLEEQGRGCLAEAEMLPESARIFKEHIPKEDWEKFDGDVRPRICFSRGNLGVLESMPAPDDFGDVYDMGNML
ncbi:hypothetical protein N431DRAFT_550764 [Stipitochalara longipes BDJ]|nr:hypothetical protein N431DRAFT_550764 [Stipitochalara longipes BDJ]